MMQIVAFAAVFLLALWVALDIAAHKVGDNTSNTGLLFAGVSGVVLAITVMATVLAIIGIYSLWLLLAALLCLCVAVKAAARVWLGVPLFSVGVFVRLIKARKGLHWAGTLTTVVIVAAGVLYALFPTHYLLGGRDYGLYEINAIHIAQTGGYQYGVDGYYADNYEDIKDIVTLAAPALFDGYENGYSGQLGRVDPQFLPAFSSLLAVAYGLLGFTGLLRVNTLLSLLALGTLYFLAKRFWNERVALLAVLFLALCPAQLWGARVTQSEQLSQWLFLLTAYCLAVGWQENRTPWFVAGGLAASFGCFVRIDNYILLIALFGIAGYALLWRPSRIRGALVAAGAAAVLGGVSVWYGFSQHPTYIYDHWQGKGLRPLVYATAAALAVVLVLLAVRLLLGKKRLYNPLLSIATSTPAAAIVCGLLAVAGIGAYFVRPLLSPGSFVAASLVEYGWYICAVSYPLALYGLYGVLGGHATRKEARTRLEPLLYLLLCGLGSVVMYTLSPSISWDHFWASRRWVPVNFPFLLLLAAAGIVRLGGLFARHKQKLLRVGGRVVACVLALVVAGYMGWQCRLIAFTPMLAGINGQYSQVAAALPEDALVVTDNVDLASVLRVVYGRHVYIVNPENPDSNEIYYRSFDIEAMRAYVEKHGELYFVGHPAAYLHIAQVEHTLALTMHGAYPEESRGHYPAALYTKLWNANVYRFTPSAGTARVEYINQLYILEDNAQRNEETGIFGDVPGQMCYGPYADLPPGRYTLEVDIEGDKALGELVVYNQGGESILGSIPIEGPGSYTLGLQLAEVARGVELALVNGGNELLVCSRLDLVVEE